MCLGLSLALLTGCAERRATVSGKVTYNGVVLAKPNGKIIFVSKSGVQVPVSIQSDGTYSAPDVVVGENRVVVYYATDTKGVGKRLPKGENAPMPADPFLTPQKYSSVDTSGLSVNVTDKTEYNPKLEGPPIP